MNFSRMSLDSSQMLDLAMLIQAVLESCFVSAFSQLFNPLLRTPIACLTRKPLEVSEQLLPRHCTVRFAPFKTLAQQIRHLPYTGQLLSMTFFILGMNSHFRGSTGKYASLVDWKLKRFVAHTTEFPQQVLRAQCGCVRSHWFGAI